MDKTINELRSYMIEPIMKKLYDIERRLDFLEMKVQTCEKKKIQKQEIKKQVRSQKNYLHLILHLMITDLYYNHYYRFPNY